MLIKLTQSLDYEKFRQFFKTDEETNDFRCDFHHAGLMRIGSICEVEPGLYECPDENGVYKGEYYKVKGRETYIPTNWAEVVNTSDKSPVKFRTYLPNVFTIKEARKLAIFNGKNANTPYAAIHYSLKKGYLTKTARGKYQKVN